MDDMEQKADELLMVPKDIIDRARQIIKELIEDDAWPDEDWELIGTDYEMKVGNNEGRYAQIYRVHNCSQWLQMEVPGERR